MPISGETMRSVVARCGALCDESHDAALDEATYSSPRRAPEQLIVSTDGAHVPIRGEEAWKEAKMAVLVRGDRYAKGGRRGMIGQARYAGVLGQQSAFRERLDFGLRMEKAGRAEVIWLGDGAPGNWRLAESLAPGCTEILDWYHAIEHASDCGKELFGEGSPMATLWVDTIAKRLTRGDIDALVSELEQCLFPARGKARKALKALHRYYNTNRSRMRYDLYRARDLPIGSGIVESAHRHVLQRRLKNAGQRWSFEGARRMVRLRCAYSTAGPRRFYPALKLAANLTRTGRIPKVGWQKTKANNRG